MKNLIICWPFVVQRCHSKLQLRAMWYKAPRKVVQSSGQSGTKVRAPWYKGTGNPDRRQLSKRFSTVVKKVFVSCQKGFRQLSKTLVMFFHVHKGSQMR